MLLSSLPTALWRLKARSPKTTAKLIITERLLLSHNNISAGHTSLLQVYRRLVWPKYCYSSLWTSRFLVLNILVRRDLFSTERSNVQHQQDLRPRFLQLISLYMTPTATLNAQRKSINFARSYLTVEWWSRWRDSEKYDFSSLFRFFLD